MRADESEGKTTETGTRTPFQNYENLTDFEWPQSKNLCFLVNDLGNSARRFIYIEKFCLDVPWTK